MTADLTDLSGIVLKESGPDFQKFDVEKNDRALIHIPSTKVAQHFVHVLRTTEPEMVENSNGKKVPRWSQDSFAGMVVCTGDFNKVLTNPFFGDPNGCAACRQMNSDPRLVEAPKRTFALNVIKYATQKRAYDLRNNNVEVMLWKHADQKKIEPIMLAAQQQPLDSIDFMIEADNSDFKKWQIQPKLGAPSFEGNEQLAANVEEAKENLYDADTLNAACGRMHSAEELEAEISRLVSEYRLSKAPADTSAYSDSADSSEGPADPTDSSANATSDDVKEISLDDFKDYM